MTRVPSFPVGRPRRHALAVLVLLGLGACAGTPLEPLGFLDERSAVVPGEPSVVMAATSRTLRDLDLAVVTCRHDDASGRVVARSRLDELVRIEIDGHADHRSRLTVQAEWLDDGRLASAVFERIRDGL